MGEPIPLTGFEVNSVNQEELEVTLNKPSGRNFRMITKSALKGTIL